MSAEAPHQSGRSRAAAIDLRLVAFVDSRLQCVSQLLMIAAQSVLLRRAFFFGDEMVSKFDRGESK
ncbi:hypothetical protein LJ655_26185 [Paraburkholderia sp. MMS20-SJTN17]|uniref:Uncharacterized protein n=1 Tax=Paraburkholderia translucens TaxID=2886945 RepID=A0ABS8KLI6_9BURK|nr:hypothetical protein [Paraburkholderia sp. MMS20-SJTN17]MCC8405308.1 hypothetical protein [Paraburkholderia sp. MMS20-SJTN17]